MEQRLLGLMPFFQERKLQESSIHFFAKARYRKYFNRAQRIMEDTYSKWFITHDSIRNTKIFERLSRHLVLSGWDGDFQFSLDSKRILVVGAGGLGSTLCMLLAGSLFRNRRLTIIDPDIVELSNLHRQLAFTEADVGLSKAERLAEVCRNRNSTCTVSALFDSISEKNGQLLLKEHDIVFDCTDNVAARVLISDLWHNTGRKNHIISGSCVGWCGQVVNLYPENPFCLRCVYGEMSDSKKGCDRLGQCALQGAMGPVVTVIASTLLMELVNSIRAPFTERKGLLLIDYTNEGPNTRQVTVRPSCGICMSGNISSAYSGYPPQDIGTNPYSRLEISRVEFGHLLGSNNCNIIDVREKKHFFYSRFRDSLNLPASRFVHGQEDIGNVASVRDWVISGKPTVVVCRKGYDSLKFAILANAAFPHSEILSLSGGLQGLSLDIV